MSFLPILDFVNIILINIEINLLNKFLLLIFFSEELLENLDAYLIKCLI